MRIWRALTYCGAIIFTALILFPYLWIVVSSLQLNMDLMTRPPFPYKLVTFNLANYVYILSYKPFVKGFLHSVLVAIFTTGFVIVVGALGGYAIATIRFRGRNLLFYTLVLIYMIPGLILLIPFVITLKILGMLDTLIGVGFAHSILLLPLMTWLLVGIFQAFPTELDRASRVDGYSRMKTLFKIVIPLSKTGFLLVVVFAFILSWNELLFANVVGIIAVRTLQPTILEFMAGSTVLYPELAAAGVLSSIPAVTLAIMLQKYIIAGIMKGAVK